MKLINLKQIINLKTNIFSENWYITFKNLNVNKDWLKNYNNFLEIKKNNIWNKKYIARFESFNINWTYYQVESKTFSEIKYRIKILLKTIWFEKENKNLKIQDLNLWELKEEQKKVEKKFENWLLGHKRTRYKRM